MPAIPATLQANTTTQRPRYDAVRSRGEWATRLADDAEKQRRKREKEFLAARDAQPSEFEPYIQKEVKAFPDQERTEEKRAWAEKINDTKPPKLPKTAIPSVSQTGSQVAPGSQTDNKPVSMRPGQLPRKKVPGAEDVITKGIGKPYYLDTTVDLTKRFSLSLNLLTRLPGAVFMCGGNFSNPSTVLQFLKMFPVYVHDDSLEKEPHAGKPQRLAVACIMPSDPACLATTQPMLDVNGRRLQLCSAPFAPNYYIGSPKFMSWTQASQLGTTGGPYAWLARSQLPPALLLSSPATYSQAAIQASVKDDTLVLQAQVLENPTSGNTSREQQVRLAVFQHTQGNRNDPTPTNCVVCWGLLGAPDTGRLLVAVLQGVDYLAAQKIEELIINTTTVQLKSGADVVTLDKNRDACVLGPRTYVTAQPKDKMVFQERLTVLAVWHDTPTSGWHIYAQIKHYAQSGQDIGSLVAATQLYPLGDNAYLKHSDGRDISPPKTLVQALQVPRGQESYLETTASIAATPNVRPEAHPSFQPFLNTLAAYNQAVGANHVVFDVLDNSSDQRLQKLYINMLTAEEPDFKKAS